MTEEQWDICHGKAEIDSEQDAPDIPGGGMEAVEGGAPAAGEAFAAGLASELLNPVGAAIADERMESRIGVAPIVTEWIGTGASRRADVLMGAARAFAFGPGEDAGLVGMPPERLGVGPATNRTIVRRARLQGPGFWRKNKGNIPKFLISWQ